MQEEVQKNKNNLLSLSQEYSKFKKELLKFTNQYSDSKETKLTISKLLVKLSFIKDTDSKQYQDVVKEIFHIVDSILAEYEKSSEQIQKSKQKEKVAFHKLDTNSEYGKLLKEKDTPIVKIKDLKKEYPGFELNFEGHEIELKFGEITGIVGMNATGKTTFFRCLVGEENYSGGSIEFPYFEKEFEKEMEGKLNWSKIRSRIAFVPQYLPDWKGTLKDNLKYEASFRGISSTNNEYEFEYIISRLGLTEYIENNKSWTELSGGYKLRFALAKALIWKPDFLIIDEPLAHLDIYSQTLVLNDLRSLSQNLKYPMSVILSSHHIFELERVADKILYLKETTGEKDSTRKVNLAFSGKVGEIYNTRDSNLFLLESKSNLDEIKKAFAGFTDIDVSYDGLEYRIKTATDIEERDVLQELLSSNINFNYFRNISGSSVRLF